MVSDKLEYVSPDRLKELLYSDVLTLMVGRGEWPTEPGTILESHADAPQIRSDVFEVYLGGNCTSDSLLRKVEACTPLTGHFQQLVADALEDIRSKLEDDEGELTRAQRKRLKHLAYILVDPDDGWSAWVLQEGQVGLPRFVNEVKSGQVGGTYLRLATTGT